MLNPRGAKDTRSILTGKDGMLFDEMGNLLATCESFSTQINATNAKYQPLGDAQEHEVNTGYSVSVSFTQVVIEDDQFIRGMFTFMQDGIPPNWTLQGVVRGRNGSEERMIYRQCVPTGNIDLQNMAVGETYKRSWSLFVNEPPELQSSLSV